MKKKKLKDYTEEELNKMSYTEKEKLLTKHYITTGTKISIIIIILIFIVVAFFNSFKSIPTGFVGVKTRFGQVQNTMLNEGLNMKVPFIEKIVLMDCRTQKAEYTMEASSKDLQKVSNFTIAVNYNLSKETANTLYREIGTDYKSVIIEPAIQEAIKSTTASYTAEELITRRSEVSAFATEAIFNKLNDKGINVTSVNILDLSFSAEFDAAIEKKQIVEQQTQQAKYELEKAKVENEKKIENAKAEAEVMKQQNAEITDKTLELKRLEVQQSLINKWNGQLPTTMTGSDTSNIFSLNK